MQTRLLDRLARHEDVRIVGPISPEIDVRVSTVSFTHFQRNPEDIVQVAKEAGIGIRHGHMYAYRLCEALGIVPDPGVVRISAVHYNPVAEFDRLMNAIDPLLEGSSVET